MRRRTDQFSARMVDNSSEAIEDELSLQQTKSYIYEAYFDSIITVKKHNFVHSESKLRNLHRAYLMAGEDQNSLSITVDRHFQCSRAPLGSLERISLCDLHPKERYVGGYLILRTLEVPFEDRCVQTIVEDHEGTCAEFSVYNVDVTTSPNLFDSWPAGTIFFLKEPTCNPTKDGTCSVSCQSPSDLVFVYDRPDLLRLTCQIYWPSDVDDPLYIDPVTEKAIAWYELSKDIDCTASDTSQLATRCLFLALHTIDGLSDENLQMQLEIYSELCQFYYLEGFYEKVIAFYEKAMELDPIQGVTCFYAARSYHRLRNYQYAHNHAQFCIDNFVINDSMRSHLQETEARLSEMSTGRFDIPKMFLDMQDTELIKCADYTGPVKIVAIKGKGRGVVAAEDLQPGTLLVVSKALAFTWTFQASPTQSWKALVARLSSLISRNPKTFGPIIYSLFDGTNPVEEKPVQVFCSPEINQEPILDILKLKGIVMNNAFGDTEEIHEYKSVLIKNFRHKTGCGVYNMPSYFNHSCLPNASLHDFNNVIFIRAIKSIKAGEEICIPYVSWEFPYESRKRFLSIYGFECSCRLCQEESNELFEDRLLRHSMYVRHEEIYSYLTSPKTVFVPRVIEDIDLLFTKHSETYWNAEHLSRKTSMASLHALRAKAFAMTSCDDPSRKRKELLCHLKTLNCLGLDHEQLLISLENGTSLIPDDAILCENVLFACSRLVLLYHDLSNSVKASSWIRVLVELEKIYSGGNANVLKLKYTYISLLIDGLVLM